MALLVAVAISVLFAAIIGKIIFRLRGHFLALATLSLGIIFETIANGWREVTGGASGMIGIPALFVVLEPNLGTTLIIVADGCSLLFLAGLSWYWIAPTVGAVTLAVPLAWRFVLHDYQKARVLTLGS